MANKNTIEIQLVVNDNGSVTIKQFGADAEKALAQPKTAADQLDTSLAGLKTSWLLHPPGKAPTPSLQL